MPRVVTAVVLIALLPPVVWHIPALATLGVLTAVLVAMIGYEMVRYDQPRDEIRHGGASHP